MKGLQTAPRSQSGRNKAFKAIVFIQTSQSRAAKPGSLCIWTRRGLSFASDISPCTGSLNITKTPRPELRLPEQQQSQTRLQRSRHVRQTLRAMLRAFGRILASKSRLQRSVAPLLASDVTTSMPSASSWQYTPQTPYNAAPHNARVNLLPI